MTVCRPTGLYFLGINLVVFKYTSEDTQTNIRRQMFTTSIKMIKLIFKSCVIRSKQTKPIKDECCRTFVRHTILSYFSTVEHLQVNRYEINLLCIFLLDSRQSAAIVRLRCTKHRPDMSFGIRLCDRAGYS